MSKGGKREPEPVLVGQVGRPHGVRGWVMVQPSSDVPERFAAQSVLRLDRGGGAAAETVTIVHAQPHKGALLVQFAESVTREDAEAMRGAALLVDASSSPAAPEGAFYYYDLIGRSCEDVRSGPLGRVADVVEDGGGLILQIDGDDGRTLLVPFVRDVIESIEPAGGRIVFKLPDGLLETCVSTS